MNYFDVLSKFAINVTILIAWSFHELPAQEFRGYLDYDPETGNMAIDIGEEYFTTFQLTSRNGIFTGTRLNRNSLFDVFYDSKFFTMNPGGIGSTDFGPIAATGLTFDFISADICLEGSWLQGGAIENIALRSGEDEKLITRGTCDGGHGRGRRIEPIDFYLDYNPAEGTLSIDSTNQPLSVFSLQSISGVPVFRDVRPEFLDEPLDQYRLNRLTLTSVQGFETFDLGKVLTDTVVASHSTAADIQQLLCYRASTTELGQTGPLHVRANGDTRPLDLCGSSTTRLPDEVIELLFEPTVDVGIVVDGDNNVIVHVPITDDGATAPLTSFEILATEPTFVPGNQNPDVFTGFFDVISDRRVYKEDKRGLPTTINLGPILREDVDVARLSERVTITGTFLGGGTVESVQFAVVPEPSFSWIPLILAVLPLGWWRSSTTRKTGVRI